MFTRKNEYKLSRVRTRFNGCFKRFSKQYMLLKFFEAIGDIDRARNTQRSLDFIIWDAKGERKWLDVLLAKRDWFQSHSCPGAQGWVEKEWTPLLKKVLKKIITEQGKTKRWEG